MTQRATIQSMQKPSSTESLSEPTTQKALVEPAKKLTIVELFEAHESALIRFAYSMVKRREVAEELVQEGFLKLHQHWEEVENPQAWVYRAIRNLCYNHIRKHQRELIDDKVVDISSASAEHNLERMEAIGNVRLLMSELTTEQQELIRLKYVEDKSYADISTETGIGIGNVGYKLHHLLKGLGDALKKLGVESSKG